MHILKFFENLEHLSVSGEPSLLTIHNSPLTTCFSSTLHKLSVMVKCFEECLALLDGRLKQLTTFIVVVDYPRYNSSISYNMVRFCIIRLFFKLNQYY